MLQSTCAATAVTASLANTSSEGDGKRIGHRLGEEHFRLGPLTYSSSNTAKTDFRHKLAQGWKFKSRQHDLACQVQTLELRQSTDRSLLSSRSRWRTSLSTAPTVVLRPVTPRC